MMTFEAQQAWCDGWRAATVQSHQNSEHLGELIADSASTDTDVGKTVIIMLKAIDLYVTIPYYTGDTIAIVGNEKITCRWVKP